MDHATGLIEDAIATYHAQQDLPAKERQSLRALAVENGVPRSTLSDRVSGRARPSSESLGVRGLGGCISVC